MSIWVAKLASRSFAHPVWAGIPAAISAAKYCKTISSTHPLQMRKSHPDARLGLLICTRLDTLLPTVSSHTGAHPAVGLHRATGRLLRFARRLPYSPPPTRSAAIDFAELNQASEDEGTQELLLW
jgi:hypothetical protein